LSLTRPKLVDIRRDFRWIKKDHCWLVQSTDQYSTLSQDNPIRLHFQPDIPVQIWLTGEGTDYYFADESEAYLFYLKFA
jgi:hypothetical protein